MLREPIPLGRVDNARPSYEAIADAAFTHIARLGCRVAVKCTPAGAVYLDRADRLAVGRLLVVVIDPAHKVRYREHHLEADLVRHAIEHGIVSEMRTRRAPCAS